MIEYLLTNPTVVISLLALGAFKFFPPKTINSWYGYRTTQSMKNKQEWSLAQRYSADLAVSLLSIVLIVQCILFLVFGHVAITDLTTLLLWALAFGVVIWKTEKELKKEEK